MIVIRLYSETTKRPFRSVAAPERPDHDIESCASRVLGLLRRQHRKSTFQGALRPSRRRREVRRRGRECGGSCGLSFQDSVSPLTGCSTFWSQDMMECLWRQDVTIRPG